MGDQIHKSLGHGYLDVDKLNKKSYKLITNLKSHFYLVFTKKNGHKLNVPAIHFDISRLAENKSINTEMSS